MWHHLFWHHKFWYHPSWHNNNVDWRQTSFAFFLDITRSDILLPYQIVCIGQNFWMCLLLLLFLYITGTLYSLATRVPPHQLHIVPRCNERYHKISLWRSMADKRQLMILEEQNWTRSNCWRIGVCEFMYQWSENYRIYYHTVIFTDNRSTCTAVHDGLHKSNYFIYFAIMNILCFYLKTQFEISFRIFLTT